MKSRVFSQFVNGIVAALLLSACTQTGQDRPQTAVLPAPVVVETAPPPQPVLPILKPGTKKRDPARPKLDPDVPAEAAGTDPAAAPDVLIGSGTVSPGAAGTNAPADLGGPDLGDTTSAPAYVPAEPEPVLPATPDELRGQTEIQVINVLGSPVATRAEGTGTIWTYRVQNCSLDVYFFLDVADNQRRALSYELIAANQTGTRSSENCYQLLRKAAAAH